MRVTILVDGVPYLDCEWDEEIAAPLLHQLADLTPLERGVARYDADRPAARSELIS